MQRPVSSSLLLLFVAIAAYSSATASVAAAASSSSSSSSDQAKEPEEGGDDDRGSLRDFLQAAVFGQGDDDNDDDSESSEKQKSRNAWQKPFQSFFDEARNNIFNVDDAAGADANTKTADADAQNVRDPFFGFIDDIRRTKDFLQAKDKDSAAGDDDDGNTNEALLAQVLEKAKLLSQEEDTVDLKEFLSRMTAAMKKVHKQLQENFGDLLHTHIDSFIALAIPYFAMSEDARHSPLAKRRLHRFYQRVTKDELIELHGGLYLSHLAYVDTMEQFDGGLEAFEGGSWKRLYGTTESLPDLPAHFMLIHKEIDPLEGGTCIKKKSKKRDSKENPIIKAVRENVEMFCGTRQQGEVLVAIVVRGTKQASDLLQDGLLEPAPYRNGFAHGGILESGRNLAKHYLPKLKDLHSITKRGKIRVVLIGHSLGAGAASIAAMELREHADFLEVEALGFGCPSLLSKELSESAEEYVTTVVNDADIVPRMSGSSMTNVLLDLMDYDWTGDALEDLRFSLRRAKESFPTFRGLLPDADGAVEWFRKRLNNVVRPRMVDRAAAGSAGRDDDNGRPRRLPSVLIPPGRCIHLFRDGYGVTGTYVPCGMFSDVEFSATLLDDHLIPTGYNRAMLAAARTPTGITASNSQMT